MSEQGVVAPPENTPRRSPGEGSGRGDDLRRRLIEVLLGPIERRKMTYEEFLSWADEDTLAEWVDGEVVMSSPASKQHQNIADFLLKIMGIYAEAHNLGVVISAPFQIKLEQGREPDLLFVASKHMDRLKDTFLDGPADLVVEIVSPDSLDRDRGAKYYEYERAGIPEYWLIDPLRQRVEFYQLDADGRYRLVEPDADGVYRSSSLSAFWLRARWLWQTPPVLQVLQELQVI
ncbi:MAG: Uma2 family endonuclease [Acidobacteriota bacterium]